MSEYRWLYRCVWVTSSGTRCSRNGYHPTPGGRLCAQHSKLLIRWIEVFGQLPYVQLVWP